LRAETAAKLLYRELKADIVSMRRKPGEAIVERDVASRYGVSRTPVREAILRLADDALVDIFPQSGTFVSKIPIGSLPEAIIIRKALEQMTASLAAEAASPGDVVELHELIELQRRMQKVGDRERFHQADEAFHAKIAELAGHPRIWTLIQQVKIQVDRYRRLTLPVPGRMVRVLREHATIVKAIEAGNSSGAANAMAAHLDGLSASISDVRNLNPEYFVEEVRQLSGDAP
jgi:DNA-binding GntR family transcriptional regulator